jgi:uncharacterized cupredoxin-like copper-binding protein
MQLFSTPIPSPSKRNAVLVACGLIVGSVVVNSEAMSFAATTTTVPKSTEKTPAPKPVSTTIAVKKTAAKKTAANDVFVVDIVMGPIKYAPLTVVVPAGKKVQFRFKNTSNVVHEALLGSEAEQKKHEAEMREMAGMEMSHPDEPGYISVPAGKTKVLEWTFPKPGRAIIGCHQPDHYKGGMKLNIVVKPSSSIG